MGHNQVCLAGFSEVSVLTLKAPILSPAFKCFKFRKPAADGISSFTVLRPWANSFELL